MEIEISMRFLIPFVLQGSSTDCGKHSFGLNGPDLQLE